MRSIRPLTIAIVVCSGITARAADHRVEKLEEAPPADALAKPIAEQLQPTGLKVIRGTSRTVADIWLAKAWDVKEDFTPAIDRIYPFQPGQLVGAIRFKNKGADFRDQTIPAGVYTLRYALQPVDGNHVGTSPIRDFFVLVRAEDDESADTIAYEELAKLSAKAVESNHPGMFSLQPKRGEPEKLPSLRHNEEHDWWILQAEGNVRAGKETSPLRFDVVVVGAAIE